MIYISFSLIVVCIPLNIYVGGLYNKLYEKGITDRTGKVSYSVLVSALAKTIDSKEMYRIKKCLYIYVFTLFLFYSSILITLLAVLTRAFR